MKNLIILILFLFSFGFTAQNIDFTNKVIPKEKIGVHNRTFKLNGFYYNKRMQIKSENDTARYISPIIFFKDGTALNFDFTGNGSIARSVKKKGKKCFLGTRQDFNTIIDFFKCYAEIVNRKKIHSVYSIDGNIIRIQHFGEDFVVEERGVVLNDSIFVIKQRIDSRTQGIDSEDFIFQFQSSNKPDPTKMKPSSQIKKYFFR